RIVQRRAVPMQRQPFPYGEPAFVEAEYDQHRERQMQEHECQLRINSKRALLHSSPFVSRRVVSSTSRIALASMSTSDAAEPNGQSRAVVNWFCTRLPSI